LALTLAVAGAGCKDKGVADQPKATYESSVESQLDMVADASQFMVVRDLRPFVDLLRLGHGLVSKAGPKFLDMAKADPGERKEFDEGLADVGKLLAAIDASGVALEKGAVVSGDPDEDGVFLIPVADLDGVRRFIETMEEDPSKVDERCAKVPGLDGWVGCAEKKATVEAYKPGKQGTARRDEIAQQLPNFDVAQANVLAAAPEASLAMTTDPGLFSIAIHPKEKLPDEVKRLAGKGKAKALRYAGPGDGFVWGRADVEAAMSEAGNDIPAMARAPIKSLDGEVYLGGVSNIAPGGALLVGVSNPVPVRGLLDMALAMRSELPDSIPEIPGSSLSIDVKDAKAGDQAYRIAEVKFDAPELQKAKDMGLNPSAVAFVGPEYATVGVGMSAADAEKLANATGEGPNEALLAALPPAAAADLRAGEVTAIYHAPYDIIQSPAMGEGLAELMKEAPDAEFDPASLPELMKMLAPLSAVTVWASHVDTMPVIHVAVRTFGDERTEQGKAERSAMAAVASGTSPADAYGKLASSYDKSPRAASYRARSAKSTDVGSAMGFAGLGIAAAVAIPAMLKYQTRAMEIGATSAEMEAEMAAMEAEMAAERAAIEAAVDGQAPPNPDAERQQAPTP
jgi:hypothetical protein